MKYSILFGFIFLSAALTSQSLVVRGVLQDSSGNSLPAATVMLLSAKDSIMQEFVTSGDDGTFKIRAAKIKTMSCRSYSWDWRL
ncbi:MAG: carboxypeptidase regulatory-like domain-containing protein [Saprospiraceae bacterium]|nr:carboxypeptidase regulatory-like domain-containing protein [Saprospiraceae bacterium]MBK8280465.1 carboxypeptidase regulatory-like domain-containing protein [Saprospiraceae bacterium]